MGFFGTLFIIFLVLFLLGPLLRRWVAPLIQNWMMGRMEDHMRRMAGMPTRKEEKRARKASRSVEKEWEETIRHKQNPTKDKSSNPVDYMRSYAEDIEFEEIKERANKD